MAAPQASSRLEMLQARFQQKQLQEKEQKLLQLYDQQQQRAYQVAQRGSSGSGQGTSTVSHQQIVTRTSSSGHSTSTSQTTKVKQAFNERRQTTVKGIDRSYPLEPLENKSRKQQSTIGDGLTVNKQLITTVKRTTRSDVNSNVNDGKPVIAYHEEITTRESSSSGGKDLSAIEGSKEIDVEEFANENRESYVNGNRNERAQTREYIDEDTIQKNRMMAKLHLMQYDETMKHRVRNDLESEEFPEDLLLEVPDKLPKRNTSKKLSQAEARLERFRNINAKRNNKLANATTTNSTANATNLPKKRAELFLPGKTTSRHEGHGKEGGKQIAGRSGNSKIKDDKTLLEKSLKKLETGSKKTRKNEACELQKTKDDDTSIDKTFRSKESLKSFSNTEQHGIYGRMVTKGMDRKFPEGGIRNGEGFHGNCEEIVKDTRTKFWSNKMERGTECYSPMELIKNIKNVGKYEGTSPKLIKDIENIKKHDTGPEFYCIESEKSATTISLKSEEGKSEKIQSDAPFKNIISKRTSSPNSLYSEPKRCSSPIKFQDGRSNIDEDKHDGNVLRKIIPKQSPSYLKMERKIRKSSQSPENTSKDLKPSRKTPGNVLKSTELIRKAMKTRDSQPKGATNLILDGSIRRVIDEPSKANQPSKLTLKIAKKVANRPSNFKMAADKKSKIDSNEVNNLETVSKNKAFILKNTNIIAGNGSKRFSESAKSLNSSENSIKRPKSSPLESLNSPLQSPINSPPRSPKSPKSMKSFTSTEVDTEIQEITMSDQHVPLKRTDKGIKTKPDHARPKMGPKMNTKKPFSGKTYTKSRSKLSEKSGSKSMKNKGENSFTYPVRKESKKRGSVLKSNIFVDKNEADKASKKIIKENNHLSDVKSIGKDDLGVNTHVSLKDITFENTKYRNDQSNEKIKQLNAKRDLLKSTELIRRVIQKQNLEKREDIDQENKNLARAESRDQFLNDDFLFSKISTISLSTKTDYYGRTDSVESALRRFDSIGADFENQDIIGKDCVDNITKDVTKPTTPKNKSPVPAKRVLQHTEKSISREKGTRGRKIAEARDSMEMARNLKSKSPICKRKLFPDAKKVDSKEASAELIPDSKKKSNEVLQSKEKLRNKGENDFSTKMAHDISKKSFVDGGKDKAVKNLLKSNETWENELDCGLLVKPLRSIEDIRKSIVCAGEQALALTQITDIDRPGCTGTGSAIANQILKASTVTRTSGKQSRIVTEKQKGDPLNRKSYTLIDRSKSDLARNFFSTRNVEKFIGNRRINQSFDRVAKSPSPEAGNLKKSAETRRSVPPSPSKSPDIVSKRTPNESKTTESKLSIRTTPIKRLIAKTDVPNGSPTQNGLQSQEINRISERKEPNEMAKKSQAFVVNLDERTSRTSDNSTDSKRPFVKRQSIEQASSPATGRPTSSVSSASSGNSTQAQVSNSKGRMAMRAKTTISCAPSSKGSSVVKSGINPSNTENLVACKICGRSFATDRVVLHEQICAKTGQKKRKQFDTTMYRIKGTDLEQFARKGLRCESKAKKPPEMKSNWRRKHEEFINAIRSAKQVQAHLAAGGRLSDLPPPPVSDTSDYIQCPHCGRKFNQAAAERHIPKCEHMLHNKPMSRVPPRPKR